MITIPHNTIDRLSVVFSFLAVANVIVPQPVRAGGTVYPEPVCLEISDELRLSEEGRVPQTREDATVLPKAPDRPIRQTLHVMTTAYTSAVAETDGDPFTTAAGTRTRDGVIAANFLPFGTEVRFPDAFGDKVFIVEDRMHPRKGHMADLWMPDRSQALAWGVRTVTMEILERPLETP